MYTIISGTNRKGSKTLVVAREYQRLFEEVGVQAELLSLEELGSFHRDENFQQLEKKYLLPATKFIFVLPEYNGSFPGIFKLMMDLSDIVPAYYHKKVMLVGVADGRAGNLRGLDNMTNMCHYMKMNVMPNKVPLSKVNDELADGRFIKPGTLQTIKTQIEQFIAY